jgi:hypothetical protein
MESVLSVANRKDVTAGSGMSSKLEQMAEDYTDQFALDEVACPAYLAGAQAALALPEVVDMREALERLRFSCIIDPNSQSAIEGARDALAAFDQLLRGKV